VLQPSLSILLVRVLLLIWANSALAFSMLLN
jgi:hypothetical protein